jgi:hypothetical protein
MNKEESNEKHYQDLHILINEENQKFLTSNNKSDLIQCGLDYNNYLIENIINKKDEMNSYEYDSALNKLWDNLSVLAKHCDKYMEKFNLVDIPKNNNKNIQEELNKKIKKKNLTQKDINQRIFSNSFTNLTFELDKNFL